jgi:hypothetical protein
MKNKKPQESYSKAISLLKFFLKIGCLTNENKNDDILSVKNLFFQISKYTYFFGKNNTKIKFFSPQALLCHLLK